MDVVGWILSGLLAATFLVAGGSKLARSRQQLKDTGQMDWVDDFSDGNVKVVGALEVLAAVGLGAALGPGRRPGADATRRGGAGAPDGGRRRHAPTTQGAAHPPARPPRCSRWWWRC